MRALACLLATAFATAGISSHAHAQVPDRGYGGPATVGPNFSTGKQSAPPDYGNKAKPKPYSKPPVKKVAKPSRPEAKVARKPSAKPDPVAESEPATATTDAQTTAAKPATETPAAEDSAIPATKPQTCRRFDATTGTTLEVPCS